MAKKQLARDLHEKNRLSWNAATDVHNSHKQDQAGFLRERGHTLFPEELELLGDLRGKRLAHLQCNAGQDTLSLAKLGAHVTGVDISDTAIDFARQLSSESGLSAEFVRSDVYDWLDQVGTGKRTFDIVFSSYGAICWLSDLARWARGVARILVPGGRLVLVEFHPFSMIFEDDWSIRYDYFNMGKPLNWDDGIGDYVGMAGSALSPMGHVEGVKDFVNPYPCYEWSWTIADILDCVLQAGLTLRTFKEYPFANGARLLNDMVEKPGRRMYPPGSLPSLPMMYGLVAEKA